MKQHMMCMEKQKVNQNQHSTPFLEESEKTMKKSTFWNNWKKENSGKNLLLLKQNIKVLHETLNE